MKQFIVYEMHVATKEPVAMVLPVPVDQTNGNEALSFIDLKEYPNFFDDLNRAFFQPAKSENLQMMGGGGRFAPLPVQRVGAFDASYVPMQKDFERLDERFRLPQKVWDQLPMYKDWGFAVFKLRAGEENYHPMAFSFNRKFPSRLFFPTVHVHDGKVHPTAQFDHMLYCQPGESGLDLKGWVESQGPASRYVKIGKSQRIADGSRHLYRLQLRGRRQNTDHVVIA